MTNKERYEQALSEQLNNLPVPNEDLAWTDMKKLLEEEDDDSIILPPPFLKGCGIWFLLLLALLLAGGSWYYMHLQKHKDKTTIKSQAVKKIKNDSNDMSKENTAHSNPYIKNNDKMIKAKADSNDTNHEKKDAVIFRRKKNYNEEIIATNLISDKVYPNKKTGNKFSTGNNPEIKNRHKPHQKNTAGKSAINILNGNLDNDAETFKSDSIEKKDTIINEIKNENADSSDFLLNKKTDSAEIKKKNILAEDSLAKKKNVADNKKQHFYFSAGISVQQTIPVDGAKAVPYNYLGRKGSLADYIPSVYVRLHHTNKWFIQSEFKYGAPHYTKEFTYKTEVLDTTNSSETKAFYRLKKTYYHQLPVNFNYMLTPKWSLGTGIVFNKFYAAISQQDIHKKSPFVADTLLSSKIINDKADSNFTKNIFHWMLETQYQWKRLYFGARFTMGLQPYIKFIDAATGLPVQKKDLTFNIFLRYELWNSKKSK